jgi:hypothetical protein
MKLLKRPSLTKTLIAVCLVFAAGVGGVLLTRTANAGVAGWQAGNIIGDSVFVNWHTMDTGAIQNFLNSKVPTCDTWGEQPSEFGGGTRRQWAEARGYSAPFTCLKDYSEHGKSAAQIIFETGRDFGINPQVLIVLLQKEQGLVTDTWPLSIQYRSATGYGCPDTAACDADYYGFTNQVRWAARMFRAIMDDNPNWYTPYELGTNFIRYSPDASCGGSDVYIQNRATQALYNYTPYQPNQGALDAGWGTAHCGAYGNRNFYLYFTSWFGSTRDNFVSLAMPRWMQIKQDTYKRLVGTGETTDQLLPTGTHILFVSKITVDGTTYLRTAHDTNGGESKGVRLQDLIEIPYETISNPRWMNLNRNAYKQIPRAGQNVDSLLDVDRHMYFTSKTTINGEVYVRTQHDTDRGNDKAVPYIYLDDEVTFNSMLAPRWMATNKVTTKKNVLTGQQSGGSIDTNQHLRFNSKIKVNDTWYLRTVEDTTADNQIGIPTSDLKDLQYETLKIPRSLKLNTATRKVDPLTGQNYDPLYQQGLTIPFKSKITVNGQLYLRSEVDTKSGTSLAFPMSALDEIQ